MKHTKSYFSVYILMLTAVLITAVAPSVRAQENPSQQLLGTWLFNDASSFATMDGPSKVKLDSLPQLKSQILGSYSGRQLVFSQNGNCTMTLAGGQSFTYGWSLTGDGVLVLTDSAGNTGHETVQMLTNERLVLVPKAEGNARNVIEEQHFIRQQ